MTIRELVRFALVNDDSRSAARDYLLPAILDGAKQAEASLYKLGQLLLVLILGFELINRASISEMSIDGMKLTDLSLIHQFLPLAIAYVSNKLISVLTVRRLLQEAHLYLASELYPALIPGGLWRLAQPPSNEVINLVTISSGSKLVTNLSFPEALATIVGPIVAWGYATFACFSRYGLRDEVTWVVAILSAVLIIQAALLLWHGEKLTPSNEEDKDGAA